MSFKLPNGRMLSEQQLSIINLPTNRNFVITGSPGTGKTVMAIYRAEQIARYKKVLMLVYNVPLKEYLNSAIKEQIKGKCEVNTYNSWLYSLYRSEYLGNVPVDYDRKIKWNQVRNDLLHLGKIYGHVIIDEAQDFPIELIQILTMLSENITCFVDPNQSIEAGKTDTADMINEICIDLDSDYSLNKNFRNTRQINELARLFWNREGEYAETSIDGKKPVIIRCYGFEDQTQYMCDIINQNREKNIGVIVNSNSLNTTYSELKSRLGYDVNVQMYKTNTKNKIDFDSDGVKILSYGTMKGLEFDIVLLPIFDKIKSTYDGKADMNRVYVALTRACKSLYIFYFGTNSSYDRIDTMSKLYKSENLLDWRR